MRRRSLQSVGLASRPPLVKSGGYFDHTHKVRERYRVARSDLHPVVALTYRVPLEVRRLAID
mgnify:CR=1 FL=1